jgi:NAD(P)-dependent dehydrogenase (short-subunit alcohol dehydrogenase family)
MDTSPVVVITGASAGVGRAATKEFARRSARLALLARGREGLEGAARDAKDNGSPQVLTVPVDVANAEEVERAAGQVERELGPPDVWVNNAMASVFARVKDIRPDEFRRVTEVTYLGVVYGTLAALRSMLPRDRGTIVQVGSALAYRGIPLQAPYCAAKHAIQGFHDSLRTELLHDHSRVRITMVQLPGLNTPQFGWVRSRLPNKAQPVPPIFEPEIAGQAILWAAEHAPRELNVGLPTVLTRAANKLFPALVDRYLARTGFASQQTDEPRPTDQPDNLEQPQDDDVDFGAHGTFGDRAWGFSPQLWAAKRKPLIAAGALASALLGAGVIRQTGD